MTKGYLSTRFDLCWSNTGGNAPCVKSEGGAERSDGSIELTDVMADKVVAIITATAETGKIGDGKIFVSSLENIIIIRTGDSVEAAT